MADKSGKLDQLNFRIIDTDSDDYGQTLLIRHEILRRPLGKSIAEDDLSRENEDCILGAFYGEQLIAMATLKDSSEKDALLRYVVVDETWRRSGIGTAIILRLEEEARRRNKKSIRLMARITVVPFYENLGYSKIGEPFIPDNHSVVHVWMARDL
ncbi:MAG: GNAT family N-acetyltransferase [Clostridiaceae bacterium]|jgi:predicted GNAT family N-acyltransferase|nr:GNAT family N-acetyltransferase [Clostridiaceae bacterium]